MSDYSVKVGSRAEWISVLSGLMALDVPYWSKRPIEDVIKSAYDVGGYTGFILYDEGANTLSSAKPTHKGSEEKSFFEIIRIIENKIDIRLNSEYTAVVRPDGVHVGCQTFPLEIAVKLGEMAQRMIDFNEDK